MIGRDHHPHVAAASPTGTPNRSVSRLPRLGHPSVVAPPAIALFLLRFDGPLDALGVEPPRVGPTGSRTGGVWTYAPTVPAYVIIETDVHDPEQYERYKAASPDSIAAGGGRFVARGGELAVLEGDWHPSRLVVLEFADLEAAKRWYDSPGYREVRRLRESAATLRVVAVEGL